MLRLVKSSFLLLMTMGMLVTTDSVEGADKRKSAMNDLSQVDEDFAYQGEYEGTLWSQGYYQQPVGLQLVALGSGRFQAALYSGGLPGWGWHNGEKTQLKGERQGKRLVLEGKREQVVIRNGYGWIYTPSGYQVGRFRKIERVSPTLGASPPPWGTVLFDGSDTDHFQNGRMTEDGLLKVGTRFKKPYRDYYLHLEFRLPYMPYARGQGRSNSGVYLQSRYEVQILDSFGLEGKHNECGALYKYREPDVNICFPPLTWQTYDIDFQSPRFNQKGKKVRNARLTVWHNGVAVHNDIELERKTGAGAKESPKLLPTKLQNHSNPVRFRNIWIVEYTEPSRPSECLPSVCRPRVCSPCPPCVLEDLFVECEED